MTLICNNVMSIVKAVTMHMLLRLFFVIDILLITSANYNENTNNDSEDCDGALQSVKNACNSFTFYFLKYLIENRDSEFDCITSLPENGFFLICYIATYSYGQAWEDAKEFCGAQTRKQLKCSLSVMLSYSANPPEGYDYRVSIRGAANYNLTEEFLRELKEISSAMGRQFDFRNPKEVTKIMNRLIAQETNFRVRNAITKPSIFKDDPDARKFVFASGAYFKAKFQQEFNASYLTERDYYDLKNNVQRVDYVYQATVYNYTCFEDYDVVSIPFVDAFFNIVVISPKKSRNTNIFELIERLQAPGVFCEIIANMKPACIKYSAPYYADVVSEIDIGKVIQSTCKLNPFFDSENLEIADAYGNKICNFYVEEIRLKSIVHTTLEGIDPPTNECPNSEDLEEHTVISDHPTILAIENHGLIRFITIGKPRTTKMNDCC